MSNKLLTLGLLLIVLLGAVDSQCAWACFGNKKRPSRVYPVTVKPKEFAVREDAEILREIEEYRQSGLSGFELQSEIQERVGQLRDDASYKTYMHRYRPDIVLADGQHWKITPEKFEKGRWVAMYYPESNSDNIDYIILRRGDRWHMLAEKSHRRAFFHKNIRSLTTVKQEQLQSIRLYSQITHLIRRYY